MIIDLFLICLVFIIFEGDIFMKKLFGCFGYIFGEKLYLCLEVICNGFFVIFYLLVDILIYK